MSLFKYDKEKFEAYKKTDAYKADQYQQKTKLKLMLALFIIGALPLWTIYKALEWNDTRIFYILIPFCIIGANYGAYYLRRKKFKE